MVKGIESVHFEKEFDTLGDAELFAYGRVKVVETGLAEEIARCVSECAERGLSEASRVEARKLTGEIGVNVTAFHYVRVHELAVVNTLDVVRRDGHREAALEGDDTAELPSADCNVSRAVDLIRKLLAATEG